MNNFSVIYKILQHLERMLDYEKPDMSLITPAALNISEARYNALIAMLVKNEYIDGLTLKKYIDEETYQVLDIGNARITLKGLEYLYENSVMRKIAQGLTGVIDVIGKLK